MTDTATALAVPTEFHETALAFPTRVKSAIAALDNVDATADVLAKANALADYAKRIKATSEEANAIQYGKLLLAAKVGELTPAERGGRGKTLPADGKVFSKNVMTAYRKLASHQQNGRIDAYWNAVETANHESDMSIAGFFRYVGGGPRDSLTGETGWFTPTLYVEMARKVMGTIDLDPASCEEAQKVVQAKRFYTTDDDGLKHEWRGSVFLNPPYRSGVVDQFVNRLCEEVLAGNVEQAVLLTNNSTDTGWWHRAAGVASAVCFTRGRVSFYNSAGDSKSPPNGHCFFYFGDRGKLFTEEFGSVGLVWWV